jgi:hypothetical protein
LSLGDRDVVPLRSEIEIVRGNPGEKFVKRDGLSLISLCHPDCRICRWFTGARRNAGEKQTSDAGQKSGNSRHNKIWRS